MAELFKTVQDLTKEPFIELPKGNMLRLFVKNFCTNPERTAFIYESDNGEMEEFTYGDVANMVSIIANELILSGAKPGDHISVSIPPSPEALCAILAVVWIGGAYIPINMNQPIERRKLIYKQAEIRYCLSTKNSNALAVEECVNIIVPSTSSLEQKELLNRINNSSEYMRKLLPYPSKADDTAYIIFTSGSTGTPKGVEIAHGSAVNTIDDIIERFDICEVDRAIGISALDFDLSVFDLFGMLSAGGSLAIIPDEKRKEPEYWKMLIDEHNITVWNTVPALFEMLMIYSNPDDGLANLRLVLVSGDWVKPNLYKELRMRSNHCRFIALGGATEASIWSNMFEVTEVDPSWDAVPYGKALSKQEFRIVENGVDVPVGQRGELWIGGDGLSKGYVSMPEQTAVSFVIENGRRWYRTGDYGYLKPDGNIIFCGRKDNQVKLNGFRIELGEIDGKIRDLEDVNNSITILTGSGNSQYLATAVELNLASEVPDEEDSLKSCTYNQSSDTSAQVCFENATDYATARLMLSVLNGDSNIKPLKCETISDAGRRIMGLWNSILKSNKLTDIDVVNNNLEKLTNEGNIEFCNELFKRKDIIRDILTGKKSKFAILDDEVISPTKLMGQGDLPLLQSVIADKISSYYKRTKTKGEIVKIAILMGRNGENIIPILEKISNDIEKIELVFLETSDALLRKAELNLSKLKLKTSYVKCDFTHINEELIGAIDIIIAFNSMHLFRNVHEGLRILRLMLSESGYIVAGESTCLEPLGLISAAIVEDGFANYTDERTYTGSPTLTLNSWIHAINKSGLHIIDYDTSIMKNFSIILIDNKSKTGENFISDIREHCKSQLLSYMVPSKFALTSVFPLTQNGKVDRNTIASWFEKSNSTGSLAISTETEKCIADILAELIGLSEVFSDTDFFEVGGDSLLAVRLINAIKTRFAVDITMRELFDSRTVSNISEIIDERSEEKMDEGEI